MDIEPRRLPGLFLITPDPRPDQRGSFTRLYDVDVFAAAGLTTTWLQESRSYTARRHTIRGLHASLPPAVEGKTITAVRGEVLWVSVDIRRNSPTFGEWESVRLSGERYQTLYAARGFAHGCVSLSDDCDLLLRADTRYSDQHGSGIAWNDPELGIDWMLDGAVPIISDRDRQYPSFSHFTQTIGGVTA
jgi:dTDP-4-dehydrorhamnose 3,5-epimerase